jgi:hypothetical protein
MSEKTYSYQLTDKEQELIELLRQEEANDEVISHAINLLKGIYKIGYKLAEEN